ncbi:MAG: hypothetical protein P4L50_09245 [Anaerolineaceae bacterium]|nr:hypothetical protein [Anaerolineaceae bacterium]
MKSLRYGGHLCILLALLGISACASAGAPKTPEKTPTVSASPQIQMVQPTYASTIVPTLTPSLVVADVTPWITATAPLVTTPSELTLNQDLSIHPPPPSELVAVWKEAGVQLSWEMPAVVRVPHQYQSEILSYKIYRHTDGTQAVFLAQTAQQAYLDRNVVSGTKYYYTVSAMHAGGVESLRAGEVSAP